MTERVPTALIDGCVAAQATLLDALAGLDDDVARGPSLLPGWTVGHVLTHIARNGDSVVWRLEGATRGEVRDQYPGGLEQRAGDIEAGAGRPAAELVRDVETSSRAVERVMADLSPGGWDALVADVEGRGGDVAGCGAVALARSGGASRGSWSGAGPVPARTGRGLAAARTAASGGTE